MIIETTAGVDLLTSVREVRVLPVELRAATGEVLGHGRHRAGTEITVELEALDVGGRHLGDEGAVVAEGVELAAPAGLGAQVDLRVERRPDPHGHVLLAGDLGELPYPLGIPQRGQPERLGPGRHGTGGERGAAVLGERVSWVGAHRDRDRVRCGGRQLLQGVGPLRGLARRRQGVHVDVVDQLVQHHTPGGGAGHRPVALHQGALRADLDDLVEEQPGLLRQRQPSDAGRRPVPPGSVAGPRTAPSADHGRGLGRSVPSAAVTVVSGGLGTSSSLCRGDLGFGDQGSRRVAAISTSRAKAGPTDGSRSQIAASRSDPQTGQGAR